MTRYNLEIAQEVQGNCPGGSRQLPRRFKEVAQEVQGNCPGGSRTVASKKIGGRSEIRGHDFEGQR